MQVSNKILPERPSLRLELMSIDIGNESPENSTAGTHPLYPFSFSLYAYMYVRVRAITHIHGNTHMDTHMDTHTDDRHTWTHRNMGIHRHTDTHTHKLRCNTHTGTSI